MTSCMHIIYVGIWMKELTKHRRVSLEIFISIGVHVLTDCKMQKWN